MSRGIPPGRGAGYGSERTNKGVTDVGFIKCPRCELNYIREDEQFCSVCRREMRGERQEEGFELCSVCGENPVMPGKDVCFACYKEMTQQDPQEQEEEQEQPDMDIDMEDVAEMDEIELDTMPEDVPEEISGQLSLEEERSKEDEEAEREDEEEDD